MDICITINSKQEINDYITGINEDMVIRQQYKNIN